MIACINRMEKPGFSKLMLKKPRPTISEGGTGEDQTRTEEAVKKWTAALAATVVVAGCAAPTERPAPATPAPPASISLGGRDSGLDECDRWAHINPEVELTEDDVALARLRWEASDYPDLRDAGLAHIAAIESSRAGRTDLAALVQGEANLRAACDRHGVPFSDAE
jgi:hypothetical protein